MPKFKCDILSNFQTMLPSFYLIFLSFQDPKFIVTLEGIDSSYFKKDPTKKETEVAKNVAVIAPMKHEPEVESTKKVIKVEDNKVEATPPQTPPLSQNLKKVVRKRVTAPEKSPEKPIKKRARISAPEHVPEPDSKPIPVLTTKEECKFWPRCKRGDECLYLHPKAPTMTASGPTVSKPSLRTSSIMPPAKDKFKWTK